MNVRAMAASPAGGIVLVDSRNRRIVSVSADGVWEREVRLENLEGDVQHVIPPSPWPEGFGQMRPW